MTFLAAAGGVLGGVLLASAVGFCVARFFIGGSTRAEVAAWSLATGLLVQSLLFLACVSVWPASGPAPLLALDALVVAIALLIAPTGHPDLPPTGGERERDALATRVLLGVAAAAWIVFLVQAVAEPMWSTDYLAIWGLKGKTIATIGHVPRRLFEDPALYWAHREYPLLVPLSLATLAGFAGGWDDQALALFFPLSELATLLALFGFLARRVSRVSGAAACALAALCFPLYRAVNAGTAEVPFAFAVVLVSCAFLDALHRGSPGARARLFCASLFCVSVKQEGTLFVGLLVLALLFRRRRRDAGALLLLVPPLLHWGALYLLRGPQTRRDFDLTLFEPGRWKELPQLFGTVVGRMLSTEALQAWIPLSAIGLFLLVTRRGVADPLLPIFPLQILAYAVAFSVSSFDPIYAVEGAFRRIALTLFPALTIVLCARLRPPARA
jgi:hypothetical protein